MADIQTTVERHLYQGHILDRLNDLEENLRRIEVSGVEYSSLGQAIVTEISEQTVGAVNIIATSNLLKIGYDLSNYLSISVNSGGGATIDTTGSGALAHIYLQPQNNIYVSGGTTYFMGTDVRFSPQTPGAPFSLAANGQGYLVAGLKADYLAKSVTAGDGLTGGGELVANITVDLDTPGSLAHDSTSVAAGNHSHAIAASSNPGASASILKSDANGKLELEQIGIGVAPSYGIQVRGTTAPQVRIEYDASNYAGLSVNGSGILALSASGDIQLAPAGADVLPEANYSVNLGALTNKFLTLYVAELVVETLVAAETRATLSGRVLIGSGSELTRDLGDQVGDTTIYVKHNGIDSGDILHLEGNLQVEFLKVTSVYSAEVEGDYSYTVTRDMDGSGRNAWDAGTAVVNTGNTGDSFIDIYASAGVLDGFGPSMIGHYRTSNTNHNDTVKVWAVGNLNGSYGVVTDKYGAAFGRYGSGFNNVLIDGTATGILFRNYTTTLASWVGDAITLGNATIEHITLDSNGLKVYGTDGNTVKLALQNDVTIGATSADHVIVSSTAIEMKDGSVVRGQWQTDGDIFIGSDISAAATTYFSIFANAQTYNTESMAAGDMLIGDNSASKANIFWDKSAGELLFRGGTNNYITLNTSGSLDINDGSADIVRIGGDGIQIVNDQYYSTTNMIRFVKTYSTSAGIANIGAGWYTTPFNKSELKLWVPAETGSSTALIKLESQESTLSYIHLNSDITYVWGDMWLNSTKIAGSTPYAGHWTRATDTSLSNQQYYTVAWETEVFDTDGFWSSGTNIVPTVAGYYWVHGTAQFAGSATVGTSRQVLVLKNGSAIQQTRVGATSAVATEISTSAISYFNGSTDYFQVQARHINGSTFTLLQAEAMIFRIA